MAPTSPTAHMSDAEVPATPLRLWVVPLATVVHPGADGPVGESLPPHEARIKDARAAKVARVAVRSLIIFSRYVLASRFYSAAHNSASRLIQFRLRSMLRLQLLLQLQRRRLAVA